MKTQRPENLLTFQVNYYEDFDGEGRPVGPPVMSRKLSVPEYAVRERGRVCLQKASDAARAAGHGGKFGIEQIFP